MTGIETVGGNMYIRRNKNNQKRLYKVCLDYIIYHKSHNDEFVYQDKEYSEYMVYAYNKDEAIEKAKKYMEFFEYPSFYGYKIEYQEIIIRNFDAVKVFSVKGGI